MASFLCSHGLPMVTRLHEVLIFEGADRLQIGVGASVGASSGRKNKMYNKNNDLQRSFESLPLDFAFAHGAARENH